MAGATDTRWAGADRDRMYQAAEILLEARRTLRPIDDLPPALRPGTLAEAYYIQDLVLEALGEAGGWKVGAGTPDATPVYAPMPLSTVAKGDSLFAGNSRRMRGVEGEIAFLMGKDLPPRTDPYAREEVVDAIESCHPAIEILESALSDPDKADRLTVIADLQMNGGFAFGDAIQDWKNFDFFSEAAEMSLDGVVRVTKGKNPAGGDLLRLVLWLANHAQDRTGGRLAGRWITTGSWTGKVLADKGSEAVAKFQHCGSVAVRFA